MLIYVLKQVESISNNDYKKKNAEIREKKSVKTD